MPVTRIESSSGGRDPRVVEGDVDGAVRLLRGREDALDVPGGGHVRVEIDPADLVSDGLPRLVREVHDDDAGALLGEASSGRGADAATTAGDDGNPVLQAFHVFQSSVEMKTFLVSVNASRASGPELTSEPALLHAAERRGVADGGVAVDRQRSGLDRAGDPQGTSEVPGPQRAGQAVLRVVGEPDGIGLVLERNDDDHGTEDLLAVGAVAGVHRGKHGWREPESRTLRRTPSEGDGSVVGHERCHDVTLSGRDERSHLRRRQRRVTDADALHGGLQQLEEPVVHRGLDEDPGPGAAVLTGVVEDGVRRRRRSPIEVRVGEHHVGALAAELERQPLHLVRAALHDVLADGGRPGEDDLAHVGMRDEALAHDRALAGQHDEDVLRQPGLESQLAEPDRRQWRELRGLEHDGVARGQCRREAPAGDRHGEVPGHDDADDAQRLLERQIDAAGDRDLPAEQAFRCAAVVGEDVADVAGLPSRIGQGVSRARHLEQRELLQVGVDDLTEPTQESRTVGRCHVPPGVERLGGRGRSRRPSVRRPPGPPWPRPASWPG